MIFVNKYKYEKELILGIFRSGGPSMSLIIPDISYLGELWTSADLIHSTTLCYDTQKPSRPFIYPWKRKITIFTKCVKRCSLTDQPSLASQGPTGGGFQIGYALCCNVLKIGYGFMERVKEKTFGSDRILDLISGVEEKKNIWLMGFQWILFTGTRWECALLLSPWTLFYDLATTCFPFFVVFMRSIAAISVSEGRGRGNLFRG